MVLDDIYKTRRLLAKAYFNPNFNSILIQHVAEFVENNFTVSSFLYKDDEKYFEIIIEEPISSISIINSLHECIGIFLNYCVSDGNVSKYLCSLSKDDYEGLLQFTRSYNNSSNIDKKNITSNICSVLSLGNKIYRINLI